MNKIQATNYILIKLCDWYYDMNPSKRESDDNDLSILKVLKLIFFLSTVDSAGKKLLGDPFNDFKAMPLGPVETGVYNYFTQTPEIINYSKTNYIALSSNISRENKELIDTLIKVLKEKNIDLINKSPYYLVDLTHEWTCWKEKYKEATQNQQRSAEMTSEDIIKSERRFYTF